MKPGGSSGVPSPEKVARILPEHLPTNKLSIAVFGPGKGEAILVRLPDGKVGIVDGCREPDPDHPIGGGDPVRELLHEIAQSTARPAEFRISFVCLTHPHDDHYAGLGRLLEAYRGRVDEVYSVLHATPQYVKVLPEWLRQTRGGRDPLPDDSDAKGLDRVLKQFHAAHAEHDAMPRQLDAGVILREDHLLGHPLTIRSCGPSTKDLIDAQSELLFMLQEKAQGREVKDSHDPNRTSGALQLRWGKAGVLLAGDLLCSNDPQRGWNYARNHVRGNVQVVNVAHHASKGAHDASLWAAMNPRLAIVTPFKEAAGSQPPRPDDIDRLAATSVVAITTPPKWPSASSIRRSSHSRSPPFSSVPTSNAIHNAVAVSLDADGTIRRLVLAGQADIYLSKND